MTTTERTEVAPPETIFKETSCLAKMGCSTPMASPVCEGKNQGDHCGELGRSRMQCVCEGGVSPNTKVTLWVSISEGCLG